MSDRPAAVLLVLAPTGQHSRVPLGQLPFTIGRHSASSLVLRDNRASRQHCRIVFENGFYVLEDENSRHGTWVNGERVARHVLRNSDVIEFGVRDSYQLTFTLEKDEIHRLIDQLSSTQKSGSDPAAAGELSKLRSLLEVARALQNSLSTQDVLAAVVDAALSVTGCERGFLLLRSENSDELSVAVARDRAGGPLSPADLRVPTSLIRRALASRRDLLSMSFDPFDARGVRPENTVAALELRSVICLPLIRLRAGSAEETRAVGAIEDTVGVLYLDSRVAPADLSAGGRELLQTLAIEASTILENARLIELERTKISIENELKIARTIQRGLQPPSLAGAGPDGASSGAPNGGWFRAAGSSIPSTQVGGDYYDFRRLSENAWAAIVADVSGKGVSSALLASLLQGVFLTASGEISQIGPGMSRLNEFLLERTSGEKYATIFYAIIDAAGNLNYVNAGHCAPFLVNPDGRLRSLHTTAMPVGMIEGAQFEVVQTRLAPGEKLVIYSDGLTEAEDPEGHFFDTGRLRECLRAYAALPAEELHSALLNAVDAFTEGGNVRDDITALVVEYRPGQ